MPPPRTASSSPRNAAEPINQKLESRPRASNLLSRMLAHCRPRVLDIRPLRTQYGDQRIGITNHRHIPNSLVRVHWHLWRTVRPHESSTIQHIMPTRIAEGCNASVEVCIYILPRNTSDVGAQALRSCLVKCCCLGADEVLVRGGLELWVAPTRPSISHRIKPENILCFSLSRTEITLDVNRI